MDMQSELVPFNRAYVSKVADRIDNRLAPGEPVIYARGSLPSLCGDGKIAGEVTATELAYRAVRQAAWAAYERGHATLTQRLLRTDESGRQVFDYIATGSSRR